MPRITTVDLAGQLTRAPVHPDTGRAQRHRLARGAHGQGVTGALRSPHLPDVGSRIGRGPGLIPPGVNAPMPIESPLLSQLAERCTSHALSRK